MLVNLAQQNKGNRNTIYLDESGVSSLKDKKRFFILTGVIANNSEFQALSEYYFRLKYKYFNEDKTIHSKDIFWKPDKKEKLFIAELVEYLDTLDFSFIVVIVDKEEILKNTFDRTIQAFGSMFNGYFITSGLADDIYIIGQANTFLNA